MSIRSQMRKRAMMTGNRHTIFHYSGGTAYERPVYSHTAQCAEMKYWRAIQLAKQHWARLIAMGRWLFEHQEPELYNSVGRRNEICVKSVYYPSEAHLQVVFGTQGDVVKYSWEYVFLLDTEGNMTIGRERLASFRVDPYPWLAQRVHRTYQLHSHIMLQASWHMGGFIHGVDRLIRPTIKLDRWGDNRTIIDVMVNGRRYILDTAGEVSTVLSSSNNKMRSISL